MQTNTEKNRLLKVSERQSEYQFRNHENLETPD